MADLLRRIQAQLVSPVREARIRYIGEFDFLDFDPPDHNFYRLAFPEIVVATQERRRPSGSLVSFATLITRLLSVDRARLPSWAAVLPSVSRVLPWRLRSGVGAGDRSADE